MIPKAIFFGAIGTLAETTDLQRRAFNLAFAEADLDWIWEAGSYRRMLEQPGGRARIAAYAQAAGDVVDPDALHAAKMRHYDLLIAREGIAPRPGVTDLIAAAKEKGVELAFVTGTSAAQIEAVLAGLSLGAGTFDWIGGRDRAARGKPAPDLYLAALADLGFQAEEVLAIEDTPESAAASVAAGIPTLAFPGEAAANRAFPGTIGRVERLAPDLLDGSWHRAIAAE